MSRVAGILDDEVVINKTVYEGKSLFEMLDQSHCGTLDRLSARSWLRGCGWCLDDGGLDALLDDALREADVYDEGCRYIAASQHAAELLSVQTESIGGTPLKPTRRRSSSLNATRSQRSPSTGRVSVAAAPISSSSIVEPLLIESMVGMASRRAQPRWMLQHLIGLALRSRHLCGPDLDGLHRALARLCRGQRSVRKSQLRQRMVDLKLVPGVMSERDLEELLALCRVPPAADFVDFEVIFERMTLNICRPKASSGHRQSGIRVDRR